MGIYAGQNTLDEIVVGHVASMRSFADSLDSSSYRFVNRDAVIKRVRKCASKIERARAMVNLQNARKGQSPNGGDATEIVAPALLTGPVANGDAPKGE